MTTPNDYPNGTPSFGYAARDSGGHLSPYKFTRRPVGPDDVLFKITHCGVCYAELEWLFNRQGGSKYPMVPGHEVVGVVTQVGSNVTKYKPGERVGVGCFVNSCRSCDSCNDDMEHICEKGAVLTYFGTDYDGKATAGGYSNNMIAHQRYVLKIPDSLPSDAAAPLLCAGITVYSPMMRHGMNQSGKNLGVVGLGGLGHMAVKFGKAWGMNVTVLSTSENKREEAISALGADNFVATNDEAQVKAAKGTLHCIMDTASGAHPLDLYLPMLKPKGTIALAGFPKEHTFAPHNLNLGLKCIAGTMTGGIKETQEMLDFCGKNKVTPQIEIIPITYSNEALQRVYNKDVRYRFVIDIENSLKE